MENNNDMSTANAVSVARGWKVETVMRAAAAYFIVDEEGKKFLATSGKGGKVLIQVHKKKGQPSTVVCRWVNFMNKDGLNARIVEGLPIHRGNAGEFYFKSLSSTTLGVRRKTIFALKFPREDDANRFHHWWLHFNGQIDKWMNLAYAEEEPDLYPDVTMEIAKQFVDINPDSLDTTDHTVENNHELVSPQKISGIRKRKRLRIDEPSPASMQKKRPDPPLGDTRSKEERRRDKRIFGFELSVALLNYLKRNKIEYGDHEFELVSKFTEYKQSDLYTDDEYDERFKIYITGVPKKMLGLFWCEVDAAARVSSVSAVRREQQYIDDLVDFGVDKEEVEANFEFYCCSIPVVVLSIVGSDDYIHRAGFMDRTEPIPNLEETMIKYEQKKPSVARIPRIIQGKGIELVDGDVDSSSQDDDDEVVVDEADNVLSQKLNF